MPDQHTPTASVDSPDTVTTRGPGPRRTIGTLELAFFVVAAAGPLLVVAGIAPLGIAFGGISAPLAQLIAGIVLVIFAVGFTRLAVTVKLPGGFYAYIGKALGRPLGGGAALLATVMYSCSTISQAGIFGAFADAAVQRWTGADLPWYLYSFAIVALVGLLGYRQISLSAKVLGVALIAEIGVLLVLAVPVILTGGGPDGLTVDPFEPSNLVTSAGIGAMLVIAFSGFIGFESTTIYAEETKNPTRTIPRATLIAVGFLAVFYAFMIWVGVVAFGAAGAIDVATNSPTEMMFIATEQYAGKPAAEAMEALLLTSTLAAILSFHNAAARYYATMGRERLLPARLAARHPRHGSPTAASLLLTGLSVVVVVVFAVAGLDPYLNLFLWVGGWPILSVTLLQALCSVAVIVYYRRWPSAKTSLWSSLIAPTIAATALGIAAVLMVENFDILTAASSTVNAVILSVIPATFLGGVVITLVMRTRHPERYAAMLQDQHHGAPGED
ncbi:APC family permease [Rhodococcus sp. NPDC057529]|uniref:APC family permease n=1 Tax=Rhodococcus sp. NPDC057529 TaxID=3346158 RepID=UPI003670C4E1